jgi:hypothetical protein
MIEIIRKVILGKLPTMEEIKNSLGELCSSNCLKNECDQCGIIDGIINSHTNCPFNSDNPQKILSVLYNSYWLSHFSELFKCENGWIIPDMPNVKEFVFDYPIKSNNKIILRVNTGVSKNPMTKVNNKNVRIYVIDFRDKKPKGFIKSLEFEKDREWEESLKVCVRKVLNQVKSRLNKEKSLDK